MKDLILGLKALCQGSLYQPQSLDEEVGGLFRVSCEKVESDKIQLLTPVLTNISDNEISFRRAFVCATLPSGPYESYVQYNKWAKENFGNWQPLEGRGLMLSHLSGRTTEGNSPYIAFRQLGRTDGIAFHVLPVGNWRIMVQPLYSVNVEPRLEVSMGICDENLDVNLQPGESWTLPQIIVQPFEDFVTSTGDLHKFLLANLKTPVKIPPVEYNTWIDRYDTLDVEHMRDELAAAKEVGCEVFVIDAGWFGVKGEWWENVGDWRESTTYAFYGKMNEFAAEVRAAGLKFGIWIEPERFRNHVPVVQEHPEWFATTGENANRLKLQIPEAYEYQKNTFLELIDRYNLDYLKTDMNGGLGFDEYHTEHNSYVKLFYQLIDELHVLRPNTFIECCASGAMRTDLEVMKHFDIAFPSDNAHAFEVNDTIIGMWRRYLPGRIMRWATLHEVNYAVPSYNERDRHPVITPFGGTWDEFENADLESLLVANFTSGMYGFTGSLASLSPENRELTARYISLFKEKREFMFNAIGYVPVDQPDFKVMELVNGDEVMIIVMYQACDQVPSRRVRMVGLEEDAIYEFDGEQFTGREIMREGIEIGLKHAGLILRRRAQLAFLKRYVPPRR